MMTKQKLDILPSRVKQMPYIKNIFAQKKAV